MIECFFSFQALGDIEIAVNVLKAGDMSINPIDRHYMSLECELKPMNKSDKMYKVCLVQIC